MPTKGDYQPPKDGILSKLPESAVPYGELLRIHRPLGYYLNISPYVVGVAYTAAISPVTLPSTFLLGRLVILSLWGFCIRSAGCAWNDLIDMDIDRQVSRTKLRPLPRGAVSPSGAALLAAFMFGCGGSLLLLLPSQCAFEAAIVVFFALLYPFGKRFSDHPQLILTNIAWAIPMAMSSLDMSPLDFPIPTLAMSFSIASVIVMIDIVYACQDAEEDKKVGARSMAVRYMEITDQIAYGLFFSGTLSLLVGGILRGLGFPFLIFSVGGHFLGFLRFLRASLGKGAKSALVESQAKSSCLLATMLLVFGLCFEYCVRL
uniref:Polyprenyl transferase prhE n=1 Tax=Penicillium brasilianum TaxID=104259 RepID=PRHE_PENBI|nr:RecName: Full=Polyprenyl transferase prhE; AltName: Full=Paraherquonin biosynthesis cluster protein E [Penicillium brasilianum]BAV69306.1 PrhE [Penicillium brasilianum]